MFNVFYLSTGWSHNLLIINYRIFWIWILTLKCGKTATDFTAGIFSSPSKDEQLDDRNVQLLYWFRDLATSKDSSVFSYVISTIRRFVVITNKIYNIIAMIIFTNIGSFVGSYRILLSSGIVHCLTNEGNKCV